MAKLNVNSTRMELKKLKTRLKTADRGHKLLKDKTDEMIRQFTTIARKNKELREAIENDISIVLKQFSVAVCTASKKDIELAFSIPSYKLEVDCETQTLMGVEVPKLSLNEIKTEENLPYARVSLTSEVDYSVDLITKILPKLLELAEIEKTMMLLSEEIEKAKRRVNALEYVMIPQLNETISYIQMKLDENERGNLTRLMKVKDMIAEKK